MRSMTQVKFSISLDHVLDIWDPWPKLILALLRACFVYKSSITQVNFGISLDHVLYIWDPWLKLILALLRACFVYKRSMTQVYFGIFLDHVWYIYIYEIHDPKVEIISLDYALFEPELCAIVSYFCLFILFLLLLIFNWLLFFL
jgi:hypothetical protein